MSGTWYRNRFWYQVPFLIMLLGGSAYAKTVSREELSKQVYRLQPGDQLEITVWGYSNLSRKIQIREDGTFSFPMGGNIAAAGRSLREIEGQIQTRLTRQGAPPEEAEGGEPSKTSRKVLAAEVASDTYLLRPGDQLDISVWGHDDLNQKVQIEEDETFSFPLIGTIQTQGRSLGEVVKEIQEELDRDYIVNPHVTARLIESKFSILGEVAHPGSYPVEGSIDLLTAISQAGGTTPSASSDVEIIRERGKEKMAIQSNLERILKGLDPVMNIFPRDTIYVKGSPLESGEVVIRLIEAKFSVLGEVKRPGTYPMEGPVDLLTAISLAGGINQFGSSTVELIRVQGKEKSRARVSLDRILVGKDPNLEIFPRDIIYVRRRLF